MRWWNRLHLIFGEVYCYVVISHEITAFNHPNSNAVCSVGSYHQEIHEMTEMRSLAMGQYGHNNQPSHHILYLYTLLGDRQATEKYVREVMDRGYGEDFYAGKIL